MAYFDILEIQSFVYLQCTTTGKHKVSGKLFILWSEYKLAIFFSPPGNGKLFLESKAWTLAVQTCSDFTLCVCVLLLNICALSSGGKQLPLPIPAHLWMRGVRAEHNVSCVSRKGRWAEWGQSDQAEQRARGASLPVTRTALFFRPCTPMNKYNTDPLTPWFDSCVSLRILISAHAGCEKTWQPIWIRSQCSPYSRDN